MVASSGPLRCHEIGLSSRILSRIKALVSMVVRNACAAFILTSAIIFETTEADVMIGMHYLLPKWSGENFRRRVHGIHF